MQRGSHSETIPGDAEACFAVLLDFERYTEWQGAVTSCRVLERDDQGRGSLIETELDLKIRRARYVLRYHYDPPRRIWWEYVEGDLRSIDGEYRFEQQADGTTVATYEVGVDLGFPVPGRVARAVAERALRTAVAELRDRVASGAGRA
ncbi:type II toxin-antitoxin system RatA family toxin [Patulibacter defluvii]|uniref:type II toxin-antitoxin system RatA family toxin n=1 Tax=Patulibacter defluvii TaxID=3095358 RepID=UPI002A74EA2C|nr:SRPBCC family protein [Patulibacter sp. DM4]